VAGMGIGFVATEDERFRLRTGDGARESSCTTTVQFSSHVTPNRRVHLKCKLAGMQARGAANRYARRDVDSAACTASRRARGSRGILLAMAACRTGNHATRARGWASGNVCRAVVIALLAGCYSPRIQEGAPCDSPDECPTQLRCVQRTCQLRDPLPPDAGVDAAEVDTAVDATPPDAMVLPCTTTGLTCGGTATVFMCGGHCWVHCTSAVTSTTADQACTGWQGALGQVDDATEESCVIARIAATSWIGLSQSAAATTPGMDWTWNARTPLVYTHWAAGKPDDGGNGENRSEQCGKLQTDGQWDDAVCTQANRFLCERP
jgi:Lectin C-type domain